MNAEQFAKSHLANSTHAEGKVEIDLSTMPEYKLIPLFKMLQRDVLRFKAEHPEECAAMKEAYACQE